MIRYGNDLALTVTARNISNVKADMDACITNGHLDTALDWAKVLKKDVDRIIERLEQIKAGVTEEVGQG